MDDPRFDAWLGSVEQRQLASLTFPEVSRALRALSSTYVERRTRIAGGSALSGAGKRAAFALFYAPLHYLAVREITSALPAAANGSATLVDLGCGTGAAGAAWASRQRSAPRVVGIDRNAWALDEARETYRAFGLRAETRQADVARASFPGGPVSFVAAFTLNEIADTARDALIARMLDQARRGGSVLIVEPMAKFVAPWWSRWRDDVVAAGGRADEWRFRVGLPPIVEKLDRATGLNHSEITARSLWASFVGPSDRRPSSVVRRIVGPSV